MASDSPFDAARAGDAARLTALLDEKPERLHARVEPYGWTLLHVAAHAGHLPVVDLLLERGLDPNEREHGDRTYAMHWAAAAGHLDVVRRLADAGGDVVGSGDDHGLEVIGWASCWEGCDDDAHRAIVDLLLSRGARHHVFSAVAMDLGDELRRIVAADPAALELPMSRNEGFQHPLHLAARMNRPAMAALLLELGADPEATTAEGATPLHFAAIHGHEEVVRLLLAAGADPARRDATHDGDAAGWADHGGHPDIVRIIREHAGRR